MLQNRLKPKLVWWPPKKGNRWTQRRTRPPRNRTPPTRPAPGLIRLLLLPGRKTVVIKGEIEQ